MVSLPPPPLHKGQVGLLSLPITHILDLPTAPESSSIVLHCLLYSYSWWTLTETILNDSNFNKYTSWKRTYSSPSSSLISSGTLFHLCCTMLPPLSQSVIRIRGDGKVQVHPTCRLFGPTELPAILIFTGRRSSPHTIQELDNKMFSPPHAIEDSNGVSLSVVQRG